MASIPTHSMDGEIPIRRNTGYNSNSLTKLLYELPMELQSETVNEASSKVHRNDSNSLGDVLHNEHSVSAPNRLSGKNSFISRSVLHNKLAPSDCLHLSTKLKVGTLILFGLALTYFITLASPTITWINKGGDGVEYLYTAKTIGLSHAPGSPLFNLINVVWLRIFPFGDEYWRLTLISAISSSITTVLLFRITKGWIAPLLFCASGLVVSQSTIVQTYALFTMLATLSYYFHVREKHRAKYITVGLAGAVHTLALFLFVPYFIADKRRRTEGYSRTEWIWVIVGLPIYLYLPFANTGPFNEGGREGIKDFVNYFGGPGGLTLGQAIWPVDLLWTRLQDVGAATLGNLGLGAILVVAGYWATKDRLLLWLMMLPTLYWLTNLDPQTFDYSTPSFAFAAILAAKGLPRVWTWIRPAIVTGLIFSVIMNIQLYDIGRTVDTGLSARLYYEQLGTLGNDAVVWSPTVAWEGLVLSLHNLKEGTRLEPVALGKHALVGEELWRRLEQAERQGRLYMTQNYIDKERTSYSVRIRQASKVEVWESVTRLYSQWGLPGWDSFSPSTESYGLSQLIQPSPS